MSATAAALTVCARPLSESARDALLALLPGDLATDVADRLRRPPPDAEATDAVQRLANALALPLPADPDGEPDEVSRREADPENRASDEEPEPPPPPLVEALLACLLARGEVADGAALVAALPLHWQGRVLRCVARSAPLSVTRDLAADERGLIAPLRDVEQERWGVEQVCSLLRALRRVPRIRRALESVADLDADAATLIQSHLFTFDDLTRLRPREMQHLLQHVDNTTVARALLGAGQRVTGHLLDNVSGRRRGILEEESQLWSESTPDEVDRARAEVMAVLRQRCLAGDIRTWFGPTGAEPADDDAPVEEAELERPVGDREIEEEIVVEEPPPRRPPWAALVGVAAAALGLAGLVGLLRSGDPAPSTGGNGPTAQEGGPGLGGRVLVLTEGTADGDHRERGGDADADDDAADDARRLAPEEDFRSGSVAAVLEFPAAGGALVEVAPRSDVVAHEAAGTDTSAPGLHLRVGRVTVTALSAPFPVTTPTARVVGQAGSRFVVRVVLEGSTYVEMLHGRGGLWTPAGRPLHALAPGEEASVLVGEP